MFFANTRTGTKPRPLTQYVFAQRFPTGQAFAREAAEMASQHKGKEGWIACVLNSTQDSLLLEWVPSNEMSRGLQPPL